MQTPDPINHKKLWTKEDLDILEEEVDQCANVDWKRVAERLGRSENTCRQKWSAIRLSYETYQLPQPSYSKMPITLDSEFIKRIDPRIIVSKKSMTDMDFDIINIMVIGDRGVGKSKYIHNIFTGLGNFHNYKFNTQLPKTLLRDVRVTFMEHAMKIDIMDFPLLKGQKEIEERKEYYKKANGIVLMFDIMRPETLQSINRLYDEILEVCNDVLIVIVGTKYDLLADEIRDQLNVIQIFKQKGIESYFVSNNTYHQLMKPLNWLVGQIALKRGIDTSRKVEWIETMKTYKVQLCEDCKTDILCKECQKQYSNRQLGKEYQCEQCLNSQRCERCSKH